LGADGFRLDVADELPNEFLLLLRNRVREINPDAIVIGEVWEDASNKIAYGIRKRYFVDGSLDGCMNYPFRTAIINFVRGHDGGQGIKDTVLSILENYPRDAALCNMNMLGTHDTARILTALVDDFEGSLEERSRRRLSRNQWDIAFDRVLTASFLQFTLPGMPSIYYGDEAGMEGSKDPFNRRTYPWGREDPEILSHFRRLGKLRRQQEALRLGDIHFRQAGDKHLAFTRSYGGKTLCIYCNRSADTWAIPAGKVLLGYNLQVVSAEDLVLGPRGFCITEE
jgi:glycosidase